MHRYNRLEVLKSLKNKNNKIDHRDRYIDALFLRLDSNNFLQSRNTTKLLFDERTSMKNKKYWAIQIFLIST